MIATYRLSKNIASFEFFSWLVMVQADGASKIVFDVSNPKTKKFSHASVMERFRSIIEPGPALAGLPSYFGFSDSGLSAVASQLLPWVVSGRNFKRLQSVRLPTKCEYTVTIRDNHDGAPGRNSNRDAWCKFAEEIGAVVIEDYFVNPIHLHDRMALYAGAKMNFGVCNGPIHMLTLSSYPVTMVVNTESARNSQIRWGMQPDQSYPWMLPGQRMVWRDDSLDNLRRIFDMVAL